MLALGALSLRTLPNNIIPGLINAYNKSLVHSYYLVTAGAAVGFLTSFGMGFQSLKPKNESPSTVELRSADEEPPAKA